MSAEASTSTVSSPLPPSAQAGPLPTKQGEFGYREDLNAAEEGRSNAGDDQPVLPARHPADRDHPDEPQQESSPSPDNTSPSNPSSSTDALSTNSMAKRRLLKFFRVKPRKIPTYGGFQLTTLIFFLCQMMVIAGTITGWALTVQKLNKGSGGTNSDGLTASSSIFVHVVFGIALVGQLIFLERRVFVLRAERYSHKHPGEVLPSSRYLGMGADTSIAYAPWNRPPLPTYAAALAQSGVGTGDVEDHLIAQPPPPAYGNTRGSTLILQGFLTQTQRTERPPSAHSQMSEHSPRPLSYRSTDSTWEEIQDAERARKLEETLATLERPGSRRT